MIGTPANLQPEQEPGDSNKRHKKVPAFLVPLLRFETLFLCTR